MKGMNRVKRGRGFRGVLNYVFGRDSEHKNAPGVLLGGNMSGHDPQSLAQEFGITRRLRHDIEKPVWHNGLRLPAGEFLSHDEWVKVADAYMEKMGFSPLHPRCYALHDDKEGQHIHIAASRIALDGSLYLGKNENLASTRIVQQLEIEHGLTITKGPEYTPDGKIKMPVAKKPTKDELEKAVRTEAKPPRLVLQEWLNEATREPKTAPDFVEYLEQRGVIVLPNIASTGRLNGFSFHYEGVTFKGSSLGDRYKWANLAKEVDYDQLEMVKSLPTSSELQSIASLTLSEMQGMRQELQSLPDAIADRTAGSLAPLDRMAAALDQGLDTQRAIMAPLIQEAVDSIRTQMSDLAHDRVQRSVAMARNQHRKAREASRAQKGWMDEAKASRTKKAEMQAQISKLTLRVWVATGISGALFLALVSMALERFL